MIFDTIKTTSEADLIRFEIRLYISQINALRKHYKGQKLRDEIDKVELKIKALETKLSNL